MRSGSFIICSSDHSVYSFMDSGLARGLVAAGNFDDMQVAAGIIMTRLGQLFD